jgi:hypothetical protein
MSNSNVPDRLEPKEAGQVANTPGGASQVQPRLNGTSSSPPLPLFIAFRALCEACRSGDLALVQSIFAEFGQDFDAEDNITKKLGPSMAAAASEGHAHIISYLLGHRADVRSAPLFAIQHADAEAAIRVFEVLFDYGLDLQDFPNLLGYVFILPRHNYCTMS